MLIPFMKLLSNNHFALIILLSFSLLLSTSCKEAIKSLSDLSALRDELIREYKEQDIDVVVQNSHVLGITFNNSSFNNLREQERATKAQEIALFARNHYASINSIDKIWVSFVISKNYIIFHYNDGLGTYLFEKRNLKPAGTPDDVGPQGDVIASYNPSSNRTDVYLKKNLQLYSDARSNVMLLPHFILAGDNVRAPQKVVPESVALDFTAYSDKRMFPDAPALDIYVDGQKVFAGKARLTNVMGSNAEKSVNEFLSQEISYRQFLQLTDGKRVQINLGPKKFELTVEQLEALQSMRRCVEDLRCT
jgi:hypothetical protein